MTARRIRTKLDVISFMDDPKLCGPYFKGASWDGWRAVLKAMDALPMTDAEIAFVKSISGDRPMPVRKAREVYAIGGRRSGKDSIASLLAASAAASFDQRHRLRGGERALVLCLAVDRSQGAIVLNYTRSLFQDVALLRGLVESETKDGFRLTNGVDIAIGTNSYRSVRGKPVLLAILDETAFWRDENSATPDFSVYQALKPALSTLDGRIIAISTPHKKSGLLYNKHHDHFGRDGDAFVIVAPTRLLNPLIPQETVDAAIAEDGPHGRAEWLAEWRADVSQFLDRELIESCVDRGVLVRPKIPGVRNYVAFTDPAGGAGGDSATLAICHRDGKVGSEVIVADCLVEVKPPFDPLAVSREMAAVIQSYGLREVTGDRYSGDFVVRAFAAANVTYRHSQLDRSAIYGEALGIFTSGRARLIDNARLVSQLAGLERKVTATRDRIDHPTGQHDDLANAVCGAMVLANSKPKVVTSGVSCIVVSQGVRSIPGSDTFTGASRRVWERTIRGLI